MTFEFLNNVPDYYKEKPLIISGPESFDFYEKEYITIKENTILSTIYEIRFNSYSSTSKQIEAVNKVLIVGHEDYIYLFNTIEQKNILSLKLNGYFNQFIIEDNLIYVSDAVGLYCINIDGSVIWANSNLGVDGVIINKLEATTIRISAECDPSNGWKEFVLDKRTGEII